MDVVDDKELADQVARIEFGSFGSIEFLSVFDIRLDFSNGWVAEFLCADSDEADFFRVLGPGDFLMAYGWARGWEIRRSIEPLRPYPRVSLN